MAVKEDLELRKLELEIRDLERHWWERPVYLSILIPIVLATLTFFAGMMSGYFDRERMQLKRDNQTLKTENTALAATQNALRQANEDAQKYLEYIRGQILLAAPSLLHQGGDTPTIDEHQLPRQNQPSPTPEQKK